MESTSNTEMDTLSLTRENNRLLTENNQLLKKIVKNARMEFWFKVLLYLVIFGLPLIFYSFFMNSLSAMLGASASPDNTENNQTSLSNTANNAKEILNLLKN